MTGTGARLDRFAQSRSVLVLAFGWGLGEATFLFIVPDLLLTLIATRSLRSAIKASVAALAGALIGGAVVAAFAHIQPEPARAFLLHIPVINAHLLERVAG